MAAAETDIEVPCARCSDFLHFSAKDTAAVGDSFINIIKSVSSNEQYIVGSECLRGRGDFLCFSSSFSSGCFAQFFALANALTASQ